MMYAVWNSRFAQRFDTIFACVPLHNRFGEYLVIYETDYSNENQILLHVCRENTKANVSLTDICD